MRGWETCGVTCVGGGTHVSGVVWGRVDFKAFFFARGGLGLMGLGGVLLGEVRMGGVVAMAGAGRGAF